jgi:hypothetical protein
MKGLLAIALFTSLQIQGGLNAVEMFYDPAGRGPTPTVGQGRDRLRVIQVTHHFPRFSKVGIHYWFENKAGVRLTEDQAAAATGAFTLHIRTNVDGFLSVWLMTAGTGREVTPAQGKPLTAASEFIVPGDVQFASAEPAGRLVVLFAQSQTEMPPDPSAAVQKLQRILGRTAPDGSPELVRASDSGTPGQVGTYVVNRQGMPVAAAISLKVR